MSSNLQHLKVEIKNLVVQGIDKAISRLKELIPNNSPKRDELLLLEGRVRQYFSACISGILGTDEQNKLHAQLSHAIILFVESLLPADLDATSPEAAVTEAKSKKRGELLYHIPHQMEEKREYTCRVRVAYLIEQALESWKANAEDQHRSIRVANVMSVELQNLYEDAPFAIRSLSENIQFLEDDDYTEWLFMVKPMKQGEHPILLKVSVLEMINGREVKKDVVLEEHVVVSNAAPEPVIIFKPTGQQIALSTATEQIETKPTKRLRNSRALRATALALAVLILTTTTIYAVTPLDTREWWAARYWENTPEAMTVYIKQHPQSKHREKATFHRLELEQTPENLHEYRTMYPHTEKVEQLEQLEQKIELKQLETVREEPTALNIKKFYTYFPTSTHMPEVEKIVAVSVVIDTKEKAILQTAIKQAVETAKAQPKQTELKPASQTSTTQVPTNTAIAVTKPATTANAGTQPKTTTQVPTNTAIAVTKPATTANAGTQPKDTTATTAPATFIQMVSVPGGTFTMGCTREQGSDCEGDEKPTHSVTLSSYKIGKYEVTQKQWRDIMGSDPKALAFPGCDNCPVESVSWDDIQGFLTKLNAKYPGSNYRLPTEAEWEYAARGGNSSRGYKYAGSNTIDDVAWYDENSGSKTHVVGGKAANELGIYDMSGNVYEWCSDWHDDYQSGSQTNPKGSSTGTVRVNRGGSWNDDPRNCRVAGRFYDSPDIRIFDLGFRLARTL